MRQSWIIINLDVTFKNNTDLAVGLGGEALSQVQRVFLTQAAAC